MNIAFIAHDKKKDEMVEFCKENIEKIIKHDIFTTGTTGLRIMEHTKIKPTRLKSGPLGGDQEIGAMVSNGKIQMVIFFRDPLTSQAHEPDISALLRLCDVYNIPLATNPASAKLFVDTI